MPNNFFARLAPAGGLVIPIILVILVLAGCGDDDGGAMIERHQVSAENGGAHIVAEVLETSGAPRVVVMLPSYGRGAADFTSEFGSDLADRVAAAGYRVILPWPREFGDGLSTGDGAEPTMELLAADVAAIIDAHGGGLPVAVLGHAYGQRVARMLATNRPDLVERLILLAAGGAVPTPQEATGAIFTLVFTDSEPERIAALELAFFAPGNDPRIWLEGWDADAGNIQTVANITTPVDTWWAGGGVVPMYVLQADSDFTAPPENSTALAAEFPDRVEVVTITDANHAMLPEQPDQVANAVLGFLAR